MVTHALNDPPLQLSLSYTVAAIFKTLKKFWPVTKIVCIKKKEDCNSGSNPDLADRVWTFRILITLPYHYTTTPTSQISKTFKYINSSTIIPRARMDSESIAINPEAMRASGIIVLVKSN